MTELMNWKECAKKGCHVLLLCITTAFAWRHWENTWKFSQDAQSLAKNRNLKPQNTNICASHYTATLNLVLFIYYYHYTSLAFYKYIKFNRYFKGGFYWESSDSQRFPTKLSHQLKWRWLNSCWVVVYSFLFIALQYPVLMIQSRRNDILLLLV